MKYLNKLFFLLAACSLLTACGGDDEGGDGSEGNGGNGNQSVNANCNLVTNERAVSRLEMPKLKGGKIRLIG